jgi:hypothetical protein
MLSMTISRIIFVPSDFRQFLALSRTWVTQRRPESAESQQCASNRFS